MTGPPPPLRPAGRVPADRFQLPVERMREGYYSDKYFVRTRDVLVATGRNPEVTMQVFQKQGAWLGGVDEAIAILRTCLTPGFAWQDLEVLSSQLPPGPRRLTRVSAKECYRIFMRKAVSITLRADNLLWLRGQAAATSRRSVSEVVDQLVTHAREAGRTDARAIRSVVGTIDLSEDDPGLERADAYIRAQVDKSLHRPMRVKEPGVPYGGRRPRRG